MATRNNPSSRPGPNPSSPGNDPQSAALTESLIAATQSIATLTGAVGANTAALAAQRAREINQTASLHRGPNQGRGVESSPGVLSRLAGSLTGSLTAFATKIIAPLAPLAILGQVLGHANSGFGAFLSTTRLLTATLAGMLLPAFVLASGAVYAIAQAINEPLSKAIKSLWETELPKLVELLKGFGSWIGSLTKSFELLDGNTGALRAALNPITSLLDLFGVKLSKVIEILGSATLLGAAGKAAELLGVPKGGPGEGNKDPNRGLGIGDRINDVLVDLGIGVPHDPRSKGSKYKPSPGAYTPEGFLRPPDSGIEQPGSGTSPTQSASNAAMGGFMGNVWKGMELAMKQIERDLSPKAQQSGVVEAWKSAQMAAYNADPLKQEELRIARETLITAREMFALQKERLQRPTTY